MTERRLLINQWFPHLLAWLALTPCCFGGKNADIPKFDPPVQNYAVIDLTPSTSTTRTELIALNDANQAAFGFGFGDPVPEASAAHDKYQVYTWQAGSLTTVPPIPAVWLGVDDAGNPLYFRADIGGLTASGNVYGSYNDGDKDFLYGCPVPPNPPFNLTRGNAGHISDGSYATGRGDSYYQTAGTSSGEWVSYNFIKSPTNQLVVFPYPWCSDVMADAENIKIFRQQFSAAWVNNKGQAAGGQDSGHWPDTSFFWDGNQLLTIGLGETYGLNDQGAVAMQGRDAQGNQLEGSLWENGNSITLRDQLPAWFRWQDWNILPLSLSNQVKEAPEPPLLPDPATDATIHILSKAGGIDVGDYGKIVWTRDNEGKWTFADIALPEGTTIDQWTSINSSGVIAAIGNGGHALLLVPMDIEPDNSYTGGNGPNQNNVADNQDITADPGNKGSMVDSVFKGDPSKLPQKHFVSPKSTEASPGDFLAFKSGLPLGMASSFEWVTDNGGQTILPSSGDATSDVYIKRNQASHILLQLKPKNSSILSDKMNVWVVWADGHIKKSPNAGLFPGKRGHAIDEGIISDGVTFACSNNPTNITKGYNFQFDVLPQAIVNYSQDIPNLIGDLDPNAPPPPPGVRHLILGALLSTGANMKWDVSQRVRVEIENPNGIPHGAFQAGCGNLYTGQPIPDSVVEPFPENEVEGNDDVSGGFEDNNPYYPTKWKDFEALSVLNHPIGSATRADAPSFNILNYGAHENYTFVTDARFGTFLRLQIGKSWYRVSNYVNWHHTMKVKFHNGQWIDNGSTSGKSADTN